MKLLELARRVVALDDDRQPGLITWNAMMADAAQKLVAFCWDSVEYGERQAVEDAER